MRNWSLQHTVTRCITLQHTAHCNILQHNATLQQKIGHSIGHILLIMRNGSIQHTATHCNTLQYTAIHCNTPLNKIIGYGVALVSRIDSIIGLFCKRALYKRQYSDKETYDLIDPTDRSHPIVPTREVRPVYNTIEHTAPHCNTLQHA